MKMKLILIFVYFCPVFCERHLSLYLDLSSIKGKQLDSATLSVKFTNSCNFALLVFILVFANFVILFWNSFV